MFIEVDSSCKVAIDSVDEDECDTLEDSSVTTIVTIIVVIAVLIVLGVVSVVVVIYLKRHKALYKFKESSNVYVQSNQACMYSTL